MPAGAASSTMYCSTGRSTTGSSSLGTALVAGRNRVARPAAGMTALTARDGRLRRSSMRGSLSAPTCRETIGHGSVAAGVARKTRRRRDPAAPRPGRRAGPSLDRSVAGRIGRLVAGGARYRSGRGVAGPRQAVAGLAAARRHGDLPHRTVRAGVSGALATR